MKHTPWITCVPVSEVLIKRTRISKHIRLSRVPITDILIKSRGEETDSTTLLVSQFDMS